VTDRIAKPWGERTPFDRDGEWPVRVDLFLEGSRLFRGCAELRL